MTELSVSLLLADRDGVRTRFWPIYRLLMAWSQRDGTMRIFGAFCMN